VPSADAFPLSSALAAIALSILLACGAGCDSAPPARCAEAGVQCQLEKGPLGVCERSACAPGETPPCFACVAQH
jgi:hypothetical protein